MEKKKGSIRFGSANIEIFPDCFQAEPDQPYFRYLIGAGAIGVGSCEILEIRDFRMAVRRRFPRAFRKPGVFFPMSDQILDQIQRKGVVDVISRPALESMLIQIRDVSAADKGRPPDFLLAQTRLVLKPGAVYAPPVTQGDPWIWFSEAASGCWERRVFVTFTGKTDKVDLKVINLYQSQETHIRLGRQKRID